MKPVCLLLTFLTLISVNVCRSIRHGSLDGKVFKAPLAADTSQSVSSEVDSSPVETEREQEAAQEERQSFLGESSAVQELVKTALLLKNASPSPDSAASSRKGTLSTLIIPTPSNQQPYAVTYTNVGPFTSVLPPQYGNDLMSHLVRKQLLDAHNYVRKLETNAATYMTKLTWDFSLESYALQWTQYLCTAAGDRYFEHSPDRASGTPAWPFRATTGENLYTTTGDRDSKWDPSEVIYKWYEEKEYYDWNTGKAAAGHTGKPVGHYKQLVRQQATAVGCAVFTGCKSHPDWRTFVSCHYDHGNIGKDPYVRRPKSRQGVVCDECPNGFTCCESGLCDGKFSTSSQDLSPHKVASVSSSEWHYCKEHYRREADCDQTAALTYTGTVPGDQYAIEFNTCQCGNGVSESDLIHTVATGLFWYRNVCYRLDKGGTYSALQVRANSDGRLRGAVQKKGDGLQFSAEAGEQMFMDIDSGQDVNPVVFLDTTPSFLGVSDNSSGSAHPHRVQISNGMHVDPPPHSNYRMDLVRLGIQEFEPALVEASVNLHDNFLQVASTSTAHPDQSHTSSPHEKKEEAVRAPLARSAPPAPAVSSEKGLQAARRAEAVSQNENTEMHRVSSSGSVLDSALSDPEDGTLHVKPHEEIEPATVRGISTTDEGDVEETV